MTEDHHDDRITLDFLGCVVLAFLLAGVAATLLLDCSGCASAHQPDALAAGVAANNAAADALAAAETRDKAAFRAAALDAIGKCKPVDARCRSAAVQAALEAHGTDTAQLHHLALLQRAIAQSLHLAEACRAEQQAACEADALHQVDLDLPELETGLDALLRGAP